MDYLCQCSFQVEALKEKYLLQLKNTIFFVILDKFVLLRYIQTGKFYNNCWIRPYHVEHTSSRPITEVKQHWAKLVLGWVTAWEYLVL